MKKQHALEDENRKLKQLVTDLILDKHIVGGLRGYWVATNGNVTDEMWVEYITNQTPPESDDKLNVT